MKILHIITTINRGGAENHLKDLITQQIKSGAKVFCVYLKGDSYWKKYLESIGCKCHALNMRYYGHLNPIFKLRALIKNYSPDIVHAHLAPAELYARFSLLGLSVSFIISRHNHNLFYAGVGSSLVEKYVLYRADAFIGISHSVKKHFTDKIPSILNRFSVVQYGIDPEPITSVSKIDSDKLRNEWGPNENTILIGTVARLVPVKSLHTLLNAFSMLDTTLNVKLVIVGDGPLKKELKDLSNNLMIGEKIIWAGFREDIPVVMNAIDLFVLTSLSEGFGLVLLEAMSASKPIICSNVSALPEIVVENETGLLFSVKDENSLMLAMLKLLGNKVLRVEMGENARKRVINRFSLESMNNRTLSVYGKVYKKGAVKE